MKLEKAQYLLCHAKYIVDDIGNQYAKEGVNGYEPISLVIKHMIDAENAIARAVSSMKDQVEFNDEQVLYKLRAGVKHCQNHTQSE